MEVEEEKVEEEEVEEEGGGMWRRTGRMRMRRTRMRRGQG